MPEKEGPFTPKDRILFPLFFLSLLITAFLAGNFFRTFIAIISVILLIAFFYPLIKLRTFSRDLATKTKELAYILSFSILATLIFMIGLPYLLFHNSFSNVFVVQYAYLLPVLFVFFSSGYFFAHIIKNEPIRYKPLIKLSLIFALVLSVVVSAGLVFGINNLYDDRAKIYSQGYEKAISEFNAKTQNLYPEDLPIFNEIKESQAAFLDKADKEKTEFQAFDSKKGLCIKSYCFRVIADKIDSVFRLTVESLITSGTLKKANEEYDYITDEKFKKEFGSLENYSAFLKRKIDSSGFTITELKTENKETLALVESDFNYKDLNKLKASMTKEFESYSLMEPGIIGIGSLLGKSIFYTAEHSAPFKELNRLIVKIVIYTKQQSKNDDLFVKIYKNKDINEPLKSKAIRYRIIADRIDKKRSQ